MFNLINLRINGFCINISVSQIDFVSDSINWMIFTYTFMYEFYRKNMASLKHNARNIYSVVSGGRWRTRPVHTTADSGMTWSGTTTYTLHLHTAPPPRLARDSVWWKSTAVGLWGTQVREHVTHQCHPWSAGSDSNPFLAVAGHMRSNVFFFCISPLIE